MLPLLPGLMAAASLGAALFLVRGQRALVDEVHSLKRQLRDLSGRLATAEKKAEEAGTRADAAGNILLEKGLANEEELEAARRGFEAPEDPQPARGSRTLH